MIASKSVQPVFMGHLGLAVRILSFFMSSLYELSCIYLQESYLLGFLHENQGLLETISLRVDCWLLFHLSP